MPVEPSTDFGKPLMLYLSLANTGLILLDILLIIFARSIFPDSLLGLVMLIPCALSMTLFFTNIAFLIFKDPAGSIISLSLNTIGVILSTIFVILWAGKPL
jgi:hypothetical protein